MERLGGTLKALWVRFLSLSPQGRLLYGGAGAVLLGSLVFLALHVNTPDYATLSSGLPDEDLATVVQALKAKKVPYRLTGAGGVAVPREQVREVRLALAAEGVTKGRGVGFEIFDEQRLGATEFVQKVNYQRALQGELARTVAGLDEVLEARVHLVIPEESLFLQEKKPPSAAVVVKLKPGARLPDRKVMGILHLVSSSVSGLDEDHVTILSTDGQVIFKKGETEKPFQMTALQLQHKKSIEEDLRQKLQSMLEQVVGAQRVIVRVSADLDFNQVQLTEDRYDPDSAVVRSHQKHFETTAGKDGGAQGNPDAPVNQEAKLLQSNPPEAQAQKSANRQRETINYEVNHTSRHVVQAPGALRKISVAVLVDGPYEQKEKGKPPVFTSRPPEEMKAIEEIVKKAVGYDGARGDQITVSNVAFAPEAALSGGAAAEHDPAWLAMLKNYQGTLTNLLLAAGVFFLVVRPLVKKLGAAPTGAPRLPGAQDQAAALLEGEPTGLPALPEPGKQRARKEAAALVKADPARATEIIRLWLREEG